MIKFKRRYILTIGTVVVLLLLALFFLWRPAVIETRFNPVPFSKLPGWGKGNLLPSLTTFQESCKVFLKKSPDKTVGSDFVQLKAEDWFPACQAAMLLPKSATSKKIQAFFQKWFDVVEFYNGKPVQGLFTGYYMSALKGSLTKTDKFNVPIYGLPDNLVSIKLSLFDPAFKSRRLFGRLHGKHQLVPYYTRAEIDDGAIKNKAPVLAWVDSKIDRQFLEIQGSGVIELADGSSLYIGYVAENGAPYTAIAGVLIKQGVMTKDNASMQGIRRYLDAHPDKIKFVLNQNKSFVFFEIVKEKAAYGSQGTSLTPGYSMAVDLKWVPMGAPVWLDTKRPDLHSNKTHPFRRLMIAQDTGGAIRGAVRGDVYWGAGEKATTIAGRMKNFGQYWILLPKHVVERIEGQTK